MCRHILIIGKNYEKKLIYKFLNQSIIKKNTPYINSKNDVDYHKDGLGLSWIKNNKGLTYKNKNCYINDQNIGHIRAKSPNNTIVNFDNTHPFQYKNNIWCHNGCISKLNDFKNEIVNNIDTNLKKNIKGTTDSEILFHLFLNIYLMKKKSTIENLINTSIDFFSIINKKKYRISTNIIYANDQYVLISRHVNKKEESPSLYTNYINNNIIISSEPVTNEYTIFPNNYAEIYDIKKKKLVVKLKLNKI